MNAHLDDILRILEKKYPQSLCALHYRKDYEPPHPPPAGGTFPVGEG